MSNVRTLNLPADLLITTMVALDFRRGLLEEMGDKSDYGPKLKKVADAIDAHMKEMGKIESWTDDQLLYTARTMDLFGGHFTQHIASAFYAADSHNRGVLVAAFADLFIQYGPGGAFFVEPNHG